MLEDLTEDQAQRAFDALARFLGYDYAYIESLKEGLQIVKRDGCHLDKANVYMQRDPCHDFNDLEIIAAKSFVEAAKSFSASFDAGFQTLFIIPVGLVGFTTECHCPSIEELIVMGDMCIS